MTGVLLPPELRAQILRQAEGLSPRECCGLLEGRREGSRFHILALHPVENLAQRADRFEMDPRGHFTAQKAARAAGNRIIGCYHSHPNGQAVPSAADLEGAGEEDFLWLIAADESFAAFVYRRGEFVGADWVASSE
jgi:proteasome lid subunit RPN8/RPN11